MAALAKTERMELRISPDVKSEIEIAAQLSRVCVSQFIADSAVQRAETVISEHNRIKLSEESWNAVMEALENPPAPNGRLRRATALSREESTWEWNR
ncbi:DUF1778 domain-containing protein [Klebsiella variicola]|uniref:type II toxin-antitoxin system TacA family antitoxin n=1 Tax=Klebsiella/Raoultella group TaxID=2890311 RepID=UPI000D7492D7|nr:MULTISPECIES: DUF1778 domain-containing protein [Klebsiella/Raoultella group]HBZ7748343.1 DUF1778 domain-containing protein [Klebsiella variicola subsp. variicola]HDE1501441.1 DUF1778 domain-containing protein [Klebsiella quasipneumoniae]MBZ7178252.1 DUF1778 domain-containing protein [Klebsiella variicola]MCJ1846952.1 DUF1778 domain-containing protein [Klebsiella quasipneumoniae subsp. similipneumoniae]MCP3439144.1 DUF1778 domain-containing protein [Klebsiella variicola]